MPTRFCARPQEILDKLRTAFVELDPTQGLHARCRARYASCYEPMGLWALGLWASECCFQGLER